MLDRVSNVFFAMKSSMNNDEMEAIAKEIAPLLSKHEDDILLNESLFQRVKAVYEAQDKLNLTPEQRKLLEEYYKRFVRGGANLPPDQKDQLKEINAQLSLLSVKFGENVLKEENRFELVVDNQADLAGLPENVISAAAEAAEERGHAGKWVFTLHKPSMIPFLQYSDRRDLREKLYQAYINRGNHDDELDNKATLAEMAKLRAQTCQAVGLRDPRALRARRKHGQDPGECLPAARRDLEAGSAAGERRSGRNAGADQSGERELPAGFLGLVVLCRESEEGQVRSGRGDAAALLQAGERAPRRL